MISLTTIYWLKHIIWLKLDESTARRHLQSPWSLSVRSLHLIMVTKWSRSQLTLKIQTSRSWPRLNPLVTFESCSSIDMFAFCFMPIGPFLVQIQQIPYLTLKFKVKVMAKVKSDGHIWGLKFNRCVCFSFRGNRAIFGWDIANSIFELEKSRSRYRPKLTKI